MNKVESRPFTESEENNIKMIQELQILTWAEFKKSQVKLREVESLWDRHPGDESLMEHLKSANVTLNSWATHIQEFDRHNPQVRYVNPDWVGGSVDTEEEALEGWSLEIDGLEYKPVISTFVICTSCGEREVALADLWGIDEWVYSPEIHYPCNSILDYAFRMQGEYDIDPRREE